MLFACSAAPVSRVPVTAFATLLEEIFTLNRRLQPHLLSVQNMLQIDASLQVVFLFN